MTTMLWLICVMATAAVIERANKQSGKKTTNMDCFVVLVAWPYVLVKELMK